jgi:hypothetical protein
MALWWGPGDRSRCLVSWRSSDHARFGGVGPGDRQPLLGVVAIDGPSAFYGVFCWHRVDGPMAVYGGFFWHRFDGPMAFYGGFCWHRFDGPMAFYFPPGCGPCAAVSSCVQEVAFATWRPGCWALQYYSFGLEEYLPFLGLFLSRLASLCRCRLLMTLLQGLFCLAFACSCLAVERLF